MKIVSNRGSLHFNFQNPLKQQAKYVAYIFFFFQIKLGPINTRTSNYSAKYLYYRYDDVVAMILPVTGFRLECAKINRVESDNYPQ